MAEESVSQEAELDKGTPDFQELNNQAINSINAIETSLNLPARPSAIDSYQNVAGNPLTGSNPGSRNSNNTFDFIKSLDSSIAADTSAESNILGAMRPFTYNGDYDGAKFDRYHSSGAIYDKLGFSPYRDNEALYNDKMSFGDQFVRAAKQWDDMVGVGFMSGIRSWKTIFTDPLAPDIEGARDMERIMTNAGSTTGGIGGFFTNTFLNSGYTVGIGLNFLGEELALMGATALTGGVLGAANVPTIVGRGLNAVNRLVEGGKSIFTGSKEMQGIRQMGNTIPEMKTWWNSVGQGARGFVKGTADILNPLDQTIDALRATDYATNYAKVAKTFGAFADDMLMMKGSVSEAKLEAGMIKINLTEDLINLYRADKEKNPEGKDPDGQAMLDIEKQVDKEAYNTALWNLPAINTTNKLMYAAVFSPLKNIMGKEGAIKAVDDYIFSNKTFSLLGDDLMSKGKAALKSFKNPKFYGQFGMNYLKANLAEGVQENLQDVISKAASDHAKALYTDPIRASYEGYMPHVLKGFSDQFSAQGAETFAGGVAMGLFAGPAMGAVSVSMSKLIKAFGTKDYEALEKLQKEVKLKNVEHLNYLYQNDITLLAPDLENGVRTGRLADDLYTAAKNGNKKEALDALQGITDNYLLTGLETGKLDIIIDKIKQYKNLSREEVVEAFGKYGIKEADVDKALGKIDAIVDRAEQLKKDYAEVAEKYPNPFNPSKFLPGTPERKAAEIAQKAWKTAAYNLVFARATYTAHSKRVAEVAQIFSGISNDLAKSDAQNLMTLLSPTSTAFEITTLKREIAVLDESNPEQKKVKAEKTKQLEKINSFYDAVKAIKAAKNNEETLSAEANAKKAFVEYVKFLAKKNDNIVFNEDINKAYSVVKDYMSLKDDMKGLAESINVLMAPQNFFQFHTRLNEAYKNIVDNKAEIIENNQNLIEKIKNIQEFTNLVTTSSGLTVPNELMEAYLNALESGKPIPVPTAFKNLLGEDVTSGPKFDIALDLWNKFIGITVKPKVEVTPEEIKKEEVVKAKDLERKNIEETLADILNEEGLAIPKEFIDYYYDSTSRGMIAPIPSVFTNASGEKVTSGVDFDKAVDKWKAFISQINLETLLKKPRESLTTAEEKALRYGIPGSSNLESRKQFIEKRIDLLEKQADALGLDAIEIADTLKYLNDLLNTSVNSTTNTLNVLQKQIDTLLKTISSKGAKKTARGVKTLERITELKASYRSEFQLLNDIADRVKELEEELKDTEAVQKDLEKQAQYYNSLLADSSLSTYTRDELTARRDKINGKINTISRLLDTIKQAIYDSIKYIREHVNALLESDKKLKTFISENEYENFQYPNIKNKIESLQNEALNNVEAIEFLEESKASEEIRQAQLLNALLNYQDQVRYLEELIYDYKEGGIKDKFDNMTLNAKEVVAEKQSKYPVTISRKNARIDRRIKEAKAQNKELKQAESVVITPVVSTPAPTDLEALKQTPEGKEIEARRSKALENHKAAVPMTEESFTENQPEYVFTAEDKALLGKYNVDLDPGSDNIENLIVVDSIEKGNDLINAKYDAELKALKPKATENVISEFSFENMTPQKLNEDITLKTLKLAQSLGYEVIYDNNEYKIANIGTNSVTLKTALGTKVVINEDKLKGSLQIIKPGVKEATPEENEIIKTNEKNVAENPKDFPKEEKEAKKLTVQEYKTLFKKSVCKG